ncbi:phosphoglucomutase 2-like protein [Skeletonema marinoi]|uniref:Phosphoglucomutase 2-like protein n=1 Tax=Skeletonema marinoi TaxID=267567 RepID=A0AAD8Y1H9_9STRA|nr:phosphoglucomutase 2-like protein [Skeletonema marinoi]
MASDALLHAKEWSLNDPNPATVAYVKALITKAENGGDQAVQELQCLFPPNNTQRIGFGTAGLRSSMSPGPLGMNDLVVIQTAQGLASYLLHCRQQSKDTNPITAVVGYDHRAHSAFSLSSKQFAMYTKLVFESKGITCTLLDGYVATPILAFAVCNIAASVGIMVTASHNPKQDDGYKVYWKDGCQIRPPVDAEIASAIIEKENLLPWVDYGEQLRTFAKANGGGDCYGLSDPEQTRLIEDAYYQAIRDSGLVVGIDGTSDCQPPSFAYTAMHGVGLPYAKRSFSTFGLPPFLPVPSQQHPDANFTTVPFPNPEEKGALDEAMAFAKEHGCDIVLANDPDADRLGVAEFNKVDGKWTVFTGDQIGSLLGHWLWETIGKNSEQPVAMCASTVSSKIISAMGQTEGFLFEETLTGFKWIGSRALSLQNEGYRVLLGYEEAIGFSCGGIIPDKDGISALGVIATMAHAFYAKGKTLTSHLQEIYLLYGEFCSDNGYFRCDDPAIVKKIMEQMRNGGKYFDRVGTYEVDSVRDLGSPGYDSQAADKKPTLPTSSSSPMITFRFKNGCVAQFRASGTEPKFKYYIELRGQPGENREEVSKRLDTMVKVILEELLHPSENGLITPSSL